MPSNELTLTANGQSSQELVDRVVRQFVDLLVAGGTSVEMIRSATTKAFVNCADTSPNISFTELGSVQRDCMEVMCTWRRDISFVDNRGDPTPLLQDASSNSFAALCSRAGCKNDSSKVLNTLLEFGSVSIDGEDRVVPETPTFLLGRAYAGGRLAVDGVLRQLEGFLQVVHGNVCSVSGERKPKFERACTVAVAMELEPIFDRLVRSRGQEFIDSVDEWLERNSKRKSASGRYLELGAGVYFIDLSESMNRAAKA